MQERSRRFTHVPNFTGYMAVVADFVLGAGRPGLEILDMPAGNGLLAEYLRQRGCKVVCGDINAERPDYVPVNMEKRLPFEDSSFDAVICLEGIEHVIDPCCLIREICRVLRPDGFVVLSTPNVQSLYSRLKFLFTGTFYQFEPAGHRRPGASLADRGHVSPLSLVQLDYLFGEFGLVPQKVTGDRIKKKILFPIYLALWSFNVLALWARKRRSSRDDVTRLYALLTDFRPMMSRSLITVWGRPGHGGR